MTKYVIDTNVIAVSNNLHDGADMACILSCINFLTITGRSAPIVIDAGMEILGEYMRYASHRGQPGVGDAFFKYLWENQANPSKCMTVHITPSGLDDVLYEELLPHHSLSGMDRMDQKFLAVAIKTGPEVFIVNATDSDWRQFEHAIREVGVGIRQLCP